MSDRTLALGSLDPACELPNVTTSPTERIGSQPRPASSVPSRIPGWRFVAAVDVSLVTSALIAVLVATNGDRMPHGLDEFLSMRVTLKNVILLAVFMASTFAVFIFVGLYDAPRLRSWGDEMRRALAGVTLATAVADIVPLTSTSGAFVASSLLRFWLVAAASLAVARTLRPHAPGGRRERRRVLIVGTGRQALRIHRELFADRSAQYELLGFVDTDPAEGSPFVRRRTLGSLETLEQILVRDQVDQVYVGLPVKSRYPTDPGDPSGVRTSRCEGDLSR